MRSVLLAFAPLVAAQSAPEGREGRGPLFGYIPSDDTPAPTFGSCPPVGGVTEAECPLDAGDIGFCSEVGLVPGEFCKVNLADTPCVDLPYTECFLAARRRRLRGRPEQQAHRELQESTPTMAPTGGDLLAIYYVDGDIITAAPATMAPSTMAPSMMMMEEERRLEGGAVEAEGEARPRERMLFFVDYGQPGSGSLPSNRRRLFDASKGCHAVAWAPGQCAVKLAMASKTCGDWDACAGVVCGREDFKIDGEAACLVRDAMDFGRTDPTLYALTKEQPKASNELR